jgi:hypothetical protein
VVLIVGSPHSHNWRNLRLGEAGLLEGSKLFSTTLDEEGSGPMVLRRGCHNRQAWGRNPSCVSIVRGQ